MSASNPRIAGNIDFTSGAIIDVQNGRIILKSISGAVLHVSHASGSDTRIGGANYLSPESDNTTSLGVSWQRYANIYLVTAPIVGSDKRIKKDISLLETGIVIKLLMSIPAVQYRLIDGESGRLYYGFLAQDVEKALTEAELTSVDFAGFIKSPVLDENGNETGDYIYALRLEEFIPILWAHQQDVERRLQAAGI